jgi:hypothetical protein
MNKSLGQSGVASARILLLLLWPDAAGSNHSCYSCLLLLVWLLLLLSLL